MEIYKMTYEIEKSTNKLKILGKAFKENNRNKGKLIIKNKKFPLQDVISKDKIKQNKIKMILSKNLYNKNSMFKNCELLKSFSQVSIEADIDIEIIHEKSEGYLFDLTENNGDNNSFYNLSPTYSFEISKKRKDNVEDSIILYWDKILKYSGDNYAILNEMFFNCKSLSYLPDISKWKIKILLI